MAIAEGPSPVPTPVPGAQFSDEQIVAALIGQQGGASGANTPLVPLWMARPDPSRPRPRAYGHMERFYDDVDPGMVVPRQSAETHWLDMTDTDRKAFAEKAIAAGMWEPKDGARGLIQAWSQAVNMAADFNQAKADDKDKWISPWEALDKLYAAYTAAGGGSVDGFSNNGAWRTSKSTQVRKFTEDEIRKTAEQILQDALGRNPTDAEVNAYTIAANKAAADNPQIVTERTRDTEWDAQGRPIDSETERSVSGEVFDPSVGIEQQVRSSQESRLYKAATDYYGAAMQALNSVIG